MSDLRELYAGHREDGLTHDEAVSRLTWELDLDEASIGRSLDRAARGERGRGTRTEAA